MKIFVVRHGQTDWNVQRKFQGKKDIELNEEGIRQAEETAKKLQNEKIDIIISSPLKRAKQTAQIIAKTINLDVIYEEGLSERDFGEFEGKTKDNCGENYFWDYEKNEKYERAENIRDFFERIYTTLDKIIEKYKGKNILIVSHGGASMPINCYFNGIPNDKDIRKLALKNCEVAEYIK